MPCSIIRTCKKEYVERTRGTAGASRITNLMVPYSTHSYGIIYFTYSSKDIGKALGLYVTPMEPRPTKGGPPT